MDYPRLCPARWLSNQNFNMCVPPHDFLYPFYDMQPNYYKPWKWYNQSISKELGSTIENEKGNYKITLDVQHFRENEISVKVTDNEIIVEGKHEERPDTHGFIMRQFKRRYPLPSHCPSDNVTSTLSSDGVLTIIAEKKSPSEIEKIVPIKICGMASKKTQIETDISTSMKNKENVKNIEAMSQSKNQASLKEDHSRLLKSELLKETISETNGTYTAKTPLKDSKNMEKITEITDPLNIGGTTTKIEDSIGKSILGLAALTEQLGQSSKASTSEVVGKKIAADICGSTKNTLDISGVKTTSETCGIKGATEMSAMTSTSDIGSMKGVSKTIVEESTSSFKSSSLMSSSTRTSGKTGECVSDIISAELKEAAENV